jgi:hypothetical protein
MKHDGYAWSEDGPMWLNIRGSKELPKWWRENLNPPRDNGKRKTVKPRFHGGK